MNAEMDISKNQWRSTEGLGASAFADNATIAYDQVCNYVEGLQNVLFLVD